MTTRRNQISEIGQLAKSLAQQTTDNPVGDQDPTIIGAIEQVLGLLEQKAAGNTELASVIEASRAAINSKSDS